MKKMEEQFGNEFEIHNKNNDQEQQDYLLFVLESSKNLLNRGFLQHQRELSIDGQLRATLAKHNSMSDLTLVGEENI